MKITLDVDCTPAEAREFLGLPDVRPMQGRVMEEVEKTMRANLDKVSAESVLQSWMSLTPNGVQESFKGVLGLAMGKASAK